MNGLASEMNAEQTQDEIKHLHGCINNLFGVLALPAIWNERESSEVMSTLLDVLVAMVRLDFAYARLSDTIEGAPMEMVRMAQRRTPEIQPREVGRVLQDWLTGDSPSNMPFVAPNPIGEGTISVAPFRLGLQEGTGLLLAASRRADFPTAIERMLLQVAANQAVIALHEAQTLCEQRRVAEQLESRANERTAQLGAINEDLRKESFERKQAEVALHENQQRLRAILENSPSIIFLKDADGSYLDCNPPFEKLCARSRDRIIGKTDWELFPAERAAQFRSNDLEVLQAGRPMEFEETVLHLDGLHTSIVSKFPLRDVKDDIYAIGGIVTDITERKRAEEELRRSVAQLAEGQRISHTGSWSWNVATGELFWSREHFRIFGLDTERATPTFEILFQLVHPEDRLFIREKFETAMSEKRDFTEDYRIVRPDEKIRHIHSIAHPVFDVSGNLLEYVGTVIDATEQVEAKTELARAFEEIHGLKERLHRENVALREEIDRTAMFEEIVGSSPAIQSVLSRVVKVAPSDSTVIITGETGTGKELIARAIHKRSHRNSRPFVAFNCAGIPPTLIASELFGYEKGAFTGAQQRRLGRFELAEEGTIFLDEVGDLPVETQIALLRVLQEKEFERVGGMQPIATDVRVIAASNQNLEDAIAAGAFRLDLFHRLNVFPIEVPPLRERRDDIPLLLEYFIKRYAAKLGKVIKSVDKKTTQLCQSYSWPGNIRELQNVIERSIIVCESEIFSVDESWLSKTALQPPRVSSTLAESLIEQEKKIIEAALADSRGRVAGRLGTASRLGIPSSTLESKIRALKIKKSRFKRE